MTEQEVLKSALKKVEAQQENIGGFMDRFDIPEHWAVRNALEKQIAKKIVINNIPKTSWTKATTKYTCPSCDRVIGFNGMNYCPTCGQKLDWSEEE